MGRPTRAKGEVLVNFDVTVVIFIMPDSASAC